MAVVTLRYWAAAREAARLAEEQVRGHTLADALAAGLASARSRMRAEGADSAAASRASGASGASGADPVRRLEIVLSRCSVLVDGEPVGMRAHETVILPEGAVVEILPPFAGG